MPFVRLAVGPTVDFETMTPNTEPEAMPPSIATRGRHRPGFACDECRRRKLRCDGQQPQCGVCKDSGLVCEVTQCGTRGPKKGYLKAWRNRVVHLEAMLENRLAAQQRQQQQQQVGTGSSTEITLPTPPVELSDALSSSSLPDLSSLPEWSQTSTLLQWPPAHDGCHEGRTVIGRPVVNGCGI
ncbi:hypothetical protein V1524DRAFT_444207 [Lipomyces starkeyi]